MMAVTCRSAIVMDNSRTAAVPPKKALNNLVSTRGRLEPGATAVERSAAVILRISRSVSGTGSETGSSREAGGDADDEDE